MRRGWLLHAVARDRPNGENSRVTLVISATAQPLSLHPTKPERQRCHAENYDLVQGTRCQSVCAQLPSLHAPLAPPPAAHASWCTRNELAAQHELIRRHELTSGCRSVCSTTWLALQPFLLLLPVRLERKSDRIELGITTTEVPFVSSPFLVVARPEGQALPLRHPALVVDGSLRYPFVNDATTVHMHA
jgi:hypothetical protein